MPINHSSFKSNAKNGGLFLAFIVAITVLIVGYFSFKPAALNNIPTNQNENIALANDNTNVNVNTVENNNQATDTQNVNAAIYSDPDLSFILVGYSETQVTKAESGEITDLNLGAQNTISIMPESYLGIVKNSIGILNEETIKIDGLDAQKITGTSAKDGSQTEMLILNKDSELYVIKGSSEFLNNLNQIINFKD